MRGAIHFDDGWFEALDEKAIKFLIDGGFSKDNVSEAVAKKWQRLAVGPRRQQNSGQEESFLPFFYWRGIDII